MSRWTARRPWGSPRSAQSLAFRRHRATLLAVLSLLGVACAHDDQALPTGNGPVTETPLPNAKRWSDPANWPDGKGPVAVADVVIPKGTDILLDVSPPALATLRIDGSLTTDERDLELTVGSIHVFGSLIVGTE